MCIRDRFGAAQHGQITQPEAGDGTAQVGAQGQAQFAGTQFNSGSDDGLRGPVVAGPGPDDARAALKLPVAPYQRVEAVSRSAFR